MASAAPSDALLAAALWTGAGAAALSALLLISVLLLRLRLRARGARAARFATTWQPLFAECALHAPAVLPRLAATDAEQFLLLWTRAQEGVRGEANAQLLDLARRAGAHAMALRLAASGNLRRELVALAALGHLQARDAAPLLASRVAARSVLVSLTAAQSLVRIDPQAGVPLLLEGVAAREDWPAGRVSSILGEAGADCVSGPLAAAIAARLAAPQAGPALARLLRLHRAAHAEALREPARRVLEEVDDAEAIAAALRTLWHPLDLDAARRFLAHPAAFVRLAAIGVLARLGGPGDRERLLERLSDREWWVRYRAAQALASLPGTTPQSLAELRGALADPFAADILRQVLAEREAA